MAIIQTDPSQTKTVIALLGVLVVAIGVTIVRVKPNPATPAVAATTSSVSRVAPVSVTRAPRYSVSRNPFAKPADMPNPSSTGGTPRTDVLKNGLPSGFAEVDLGGSAYRRLGSAEIEPLGLRSVLEAKQTPKRASMPADPAKSSDPAGPKPEFALLATVRGEKGFSAVIRTGQSDTRVVEAGDLVTGGFRVEMIDDDRAVLTDGRETIVAKRP